MDIYDTSQLLLKEGSLGSTNTNTFCHHHHHHKPKAGSWPASLAAGSWGQNTVQPGTFWGVLKVSHSASGAQLGLDILTGGPN